MQIILYLSKHQQSKGSQEMKISQPEKLNKKASISAGLLSNEEQGIIFY
jgi:hypothetical protein